MTGGNKHRRGKLGAGRENACESKRRYETKNDAEAGIQRLAEAKPWVGPKVAYRCHHAKRGDEHWHFGTPFGTTNTPKKR